MRCVCITVHVNQRLARCTLRAASVRKSGRGAKEPFLSLRKGNQADKLLSRRECGEAACEDANRPALTDVHTDDSEMWTSVCVCTYTFAHTHAYTLSLINNQQLLVETKS